MGLLFLACLALSARAADEGKLIYHNGFENEETDKVWRPRSREIRTEMVEKEGRSGKCMLIEGTVSESWNYAQGVNRAAVVPGKRYRYEVSILVEDLQAPGPPFFKFQLEAKDREVPVQNSQPRTPRYNQLTGGWQTLSQEFVCPENTERGWFALEIGGKVEATIKCWIDDVKLFELPSE